MMDDGKIRFIQLTDKEDQVQEGDKIVTSSVSNKFLKGILIGYISEVSTDANKLTKAVRSFRQWILMIFRKSWLSRN